MPEGDKDETPIDQGWVKDISGETAKDSFPKNMPKAIPRTYPQGARSRQDQRKQDTTDKNSFGNLKRGAPFCKP